MTTVVFVGPTLPASSVRAALPDAVVHGPAACGDVYRAWRRGVRNVLLLDGYFDHRLSVWHKEILWALAQGVHVAGASSMGALRAAELDAFGMRGVGKIYELYRTGELEDDDEVAVLHEGPERGFTAQSVAMVNLRLTLRRAVAAGVTDLRGETRLIAAGKRLFYAERTFAAMLARAEVDATTRARLEAWFAEQGLVDQKRQDAEALLELAATGELERGPAPSFKFEATNPWHALRRRIDAEPEGGSEPARRTEAEASFWWDWLAELRRAQPERHALVWARALERALALLLAGDRHLTPSPGDVQGESERFRRREGLLTPEQTAAWLARNELDLAGFSRLAHDLATARLAAEQVRHAALAQLPAILRELGLFPRL